MIKILLIILGIVFILDFLFLFFWAWVKKCEKEWDEDFYGYGD